MEQAACAGMAPDSPGESDPFFPERGQDQTPGKMACFKCTVRKECKEYSDRTDTKHGLWAGQMKKRGEE